MNHLFNSLAASFAVALVITASGSGCTKKSVDNVASAKPTPTEAAPVPPAIDKTSAAADCAAIGAKVNEMMKKESPADLPADVQAKLDGVFAKAKDKMIARCTADKWPADFATCVDKANDPGDLDGCKLPADLEKKMMEDMQSLVPEIMAAMGAAVPADPAAAAGAEAAKKAPKGN